QHHRDAPATELATLPLIASKKIRTIELEPSRRNAALRRGEAENRPAGLRLARARFADDAKTLPSQRERHAAHGLGRAAVARRKRHAQILDDEQRRKKGHVRFPAVHWSRFLFTCSPSDRARRASRRPGS